MAGAMIQYLKWRSGTLPATWMPPEAFDVMAEAALSVMPT
jgi:hypothetical protein